MNRRASSPDIDLYLMAGSTEGAHQKQRLEKPSSFRSASCSTCSCRGDSLEVDKGAPSAEDIRHFNCPRSFFQIPGPLRCRPNTAESGALDARRSLRSDPTSLANDPCETLNQEQTRKRKHLEEFPLELSRAKIKPSQVCVFLSNREPNSIVRFLSHSSNNESSESIYPASPSSDREREPHLINQERFQYLFNFLHDKAATTTTTSSSVERSASGSRLRA